MNYNSKTSKLTFGAMVVAIFGVLLLLNRQTGMLFEEILLFIFPIPMIAFSARYGLKSSFSVLVSMVLISLLFGTFSTFFYASSQALIGMVYGACIYHKKNMTRTLLLVILLSVIANILSSVVLLGLFGYNLNTELDEMQLMMNQVMDQVTGMMNADPQTLAQLSSIMGRDFLKTMYIISMVFMGVLQGFITHALSLVILRKLRYPVPKPQPLAALFVPKWSGYIALAGFFAYYFNLVTQRGSEELRNAIQAVGLCCFLYLLCFGVIGVIVWIQLNAPQLRMLSPFIGLLLFMVLPQITMFVGFAYIVTGWHARMLENAGQAGSTADAKSGAQGTAASRQGAGVYARNAAPRKKSIAEITAQANRIIQEKNRTDSSGSTKGSDRSDGSGSVKDLTSAGSDSSGSAKDLTSAGSDSSGNAKDSFSTDIKDKAGAGQE